MVLETARLELRELEEGDLASMGRILKDPAEIGRAHV